MEVRKPKPKKRSGAQVRDYVKKRAQKDNLRLTATASAPGSMYPSNQSDGSPISGADLLAAQDPINLLPDPDLRRRVGALFQTFTKYQALQMILEGELLRAHPEIAEQIADKATELDYAAEATPREARLHEGRLQY
jgi:hypothetical protein